MAGVRYVSEDIHWAALAANPQQQALLQSWLQRLIGLLLQLLDAAVPYLCKPIHVSAEDVEEGDHGCDDEVGTEGAEGEPQTDDLKGSQPAPQCDTAGKPAVTPSLNSSSSGQASAAAGDTTVDVAEAYLSKLGPKATIITVGCWTTVKATCLLLGALSSQLPLPSIAAKQQAKGHGTNSERNGSKDGSHHAGAAEAGVSNSATLPSLPATKGGAHLNGPLVSAPQLHSIGSALLRSLLRMKHTGALEACQGGLVTLCGRLLRCSDPAVNTLPARWLGTCFDWLHHQGQCLDDIVRRSGGLPFAFVALFLSEPTGKPSDFCKSRVAFILNRLNNVLLWQYL